LDSRPNRSAAAVGSVTQQPMPSSVRGFVYVDINNDGVRDVNELGIGGVAIELIPTGSGSATSTLSVITSADGSYAFEDIPAGTYTLRQPIQPSAYEDGLETAGTVDSVIVGIANNPGDSISDVTLMPNDHGIEFNFGELPLGRLSGHVYLAPPGEDCSGRHSGSIALQDVSVELRDASGALLRSTRTNADGQYSFENLPAGEYQIVEYTPQGLLDGASQVGEIAGTDGLIRLVGVAVGGERIRDVNLTPGGRGVNYDFCEAAPAQISGNVYVDRNNDGIRQISETPLGGVLLTLVDASGNTVTTTNSADDGTYQFTSLLPGDYQIIQQQPDGFFDGRDTAGTIAGQTVGSAENPGDIIRQISIRQGQTGVDYDFGELLPSSISGRVFVDTNQDCVFDANERGLAGVSVDLLDARGNVVATTTTDAAGDYRFDDLRPGRYTLRQQQPDGMLHGGQRAGDGGGDDSVDDLISNVDVGPGQDLIEYDFCEVPPGSIAGLVFVDTDGDCVVDADEMGLGGVIVELLDTDGTVVNRTTTSADGTYVFDNLRPGRYSVREIQPEDFFHGGQRAGNGGGDDSQQDLIADVDVVPGAQLQNYDFCEIPPASIRGMVFVDSNGDCIVQAGFVLLDN
ncbi:MAG: SdrD B-like domain-containing protein, partial [Planctomycetota bacterium]